MEEKTHQIVSIAIVLIIFGSLASFFVETTYGGFDIIYRDEYINTYTYRTSSFTYSADLNASSIITFANESTESNLTDINICFNMNPIYSNNTNRTYTSTRCFFEQLVIPINSVNESMYIAYQNYTLRFILITYDIYVFAFYDGIDFDFGELGGNKYFDLYLLSINFYTGYIDLWIKFDGNYYALQQPILM